MNGVEFETDRISQMQKMAMAASGGTTVPTKGLTGWLIKKGIVNSEAGAQTILVGVIILNIAIMITMFSLFIL